MARNRGKKSTRKVQAGPLSGIFSVDQFTPEAELDFHHKETVTPYDVEKTLFEFIEDCQIAGLKRVLVITGKGQFIRPNVQKLLTRSTLVKSFRRAGYFNGQDGAFEIEIL